MENITKEKAIAEKRAINIGVILDIVKTAALIFGSIYLYFIIKEPESVLNRKHSEETINQNRAKLVLDLFEAHEDPKDILLGLSIIKRSYPSTESNWIDRIEELTVTKISFKKIEEIKNIPEDTPNYNEIMKLVDKIERKNKIILEIELLLIAEIPAKKIINPHGISSVSYLVRPSDGFNIDDEKVNINILIELKTEIQNLIYELEKYDINLDL